MGVCHLWSCLSCCTVEMESCWLVEVVQDFFTFGLLILSLCCVWSSCLARLHQFIKLTFCLAVSTPDLTRSVTFTPLYVITIQNVAYLVVVFVVFREVCCFPQSYLALVSEADCPAWGRSMPSLFFPPLSIHLPIFCSLLLFPVSFSHLLYLFSSFVHPVPFSTRVVPLRFQAGGRRTSGLETEWDWV